MSEQEFYFRPSVCGIYLYLKNYESAAMDDPLICDLYLESIFLGTWTGIYNEETRTYKFEKSDNVDLAKLKKELNKRVVQEKGEDILDQVVGLLIDMSVDYESYQIAKKDLDNDVDFDKNILVITYLNNYRKGFFIKNDKKCSEEEIQNICKKFIKKLYGLFKYKKVLFRYYTSLDEFQMGEQIKVDNILKGE